MLTFVWIVIKLGYTKLGSSNLKEMRHNVAIGRFFAL